MELFSEIYSCYYNAIRKVLESSQTNTLTYDEIANIINANAFSDSSFYIIPYLLSDEWSLLSKEGNEFRSKLTADTLKMPVTNLQKSWMKALLYDKRMMLFLDKTEINRLESVFSDVPLLFENNDFHFFDAAADGDDYEDEQYICNFREILTAIKTKSALDIGYDSGKGKRSKESYLPIKLNYSEKDDKFRLIAVHLRSNKRDKCILNMARITTVCLSLKPVDSKYDISKSANKEPIVIQILQGRNALERCMLQFASMEKQTEYDEATDCYICRIFYDSQDETELLIRILSFGPVVKVLGPDSFLAQIRERIKRQMSLQTPVIEN